MSQRGYNDQSQTLPAGGKPARFWRLHDVIQHDRFLPRVSQRNASIFAMQSGGSALRAVIAILRFIDLKSRPTF